jgi:hypothetical protein
MLFHSFCRLILMIPVLLDFLTVVFMIAGALLLWLNLRSWRRSKVILATDYDEFGVTAERGIEQP